MSKPFFAIVIRNLKSYFSGKVLLIASHAAKPSVPRNTITITQKIRLLFLSGLIMRQFH